MISITVQKAAQTLPKLVQDTLKNCEETLIVSDTGSVVLIDQTEWDNMQETLNLLRDKKSLKALTEGHKIRGHGLKPDSLCRNKGI
ncbi:MAG: hypothetical protein GY749_01295 [Desulfobacteraceae bacterium]|nr:hypothetical protein [Desulfobacteraceae bacterium]